MPVMVNMPAEITIPVPLSPYARKRLDALTKKGVERSVEEAAELSQLQEMVNGRRVKLVAGMQEVSDDVAAHPLVARFKASDRQVSAHRRVEELEVQNAALQVELEQERRVALARKIDADLDASGAFELTDDQTLRLDQLHARLDSLNVAEMAELNFLRNHILPAQPAAPAKEEPVAAAKDEPAPARADPAGAARPPVGQQRR